jgi:GntR family transcriptional regulator/MocR family aminotransferase
MAQEWSSLDLHLPLDRGQGLRSGLENALREAVREGRLAPGTRLPSSRALARELGMARGTVSQAYEQLVAEGFLSSMPRSGIVVAEQPGAPVSEDLRPFGPAIPPAKGMDLRPGLPDLSMFPRTEWLAATRHALQTMPNDDFGYGDPTGHPELREALADYLGRARGVVTTANHVIVTAGYTHALRMLCQALGPSRIAFEDPSLPEHHALVEGFGLTVSPVPVDDDGLVVDGLSDEAAAIVTPAHQYPLGVTLSPSRRTGLLAWARRTGAVLVEDDYDGEFRYDRQPVGALQGLAPDRVVYAGTISKTIAPGLRIAWLVVPTELVPRLRAVMRWDDAYVGIVDQLALAQLIRSGGLDRHLRRCRARYRRRRDRLGQAVAEHLPHAHLSGIAAGLHAVLRLPGEVDERELLARIIRHGVEVAGLAGFHRRPAEAPRGIVIGYATPPEHTYTNALNALITALRSSPPA